jgi:integrase
MNTDVRVQTRFETIETIETIEKLNKFIMDCKNNPDKLWGIPISNGAQTQGYECSVFTKKIYEFAGVAKYSTTRAAHVDIQKTLLNLEKMMIKHQVLLPGYSAGELDGRRMFKLWWMELSLADKSNLKVFGNSIQFSKHVSFYSSKRYTIVKEFCESCNEEMRVLGFLSRDYVKIKDRIAPNDKIYHKVISQNGIRWDFLIDKILESVTDLISIDEDTEPYVQLKQLFGAQMSTIPSLSGKQNYKLAFNHLVDYLRLENIPENRKLKDILNEYLLLKFKKNYLIDKLELGSLSPATATTTMSAVRKVLKRATKVKGLDFPSFINIDGFETKGRRTTKQYKPYEQKERTSINEAIKKDIASIKELLKPYVKTGNGEYPLGDDGNIIPGKMKIENAQYLFENHLHCEPVFFKVGIPLIAKKFLAITGSLDIGLHELYRSWGVLPLVTKEVMMPFVLRLAQITGMNAESIIDLNLEDLDMKHYATGKPCLRYWKERSTGAKEYHLDLFKAEIQWLTKSQSREIAEVFETVASLTKNIRKNAPDDIKNMLFISQSMNYHNNISVLKDMYGEYQKFAERHKIVDKNGERTHLTISRFRPSFVSDLIDKGVSIREVQLLLGHSSILTTMGYLDRLDFNKVARNKVKKALQDIHDKVISSKEEASTSKDYLNNKQKVIFTTPLAGCSNIFQPPDFIKKSSLYVEGQACSQYNKCLGCDNVLLTASHLPELFAMRRDYLLMMQTSRIMDTPYGVVIEENLLLLEEILSPTKSDFSPDELKEGERLSKFVETSVIDGVTA